MLRRCAVLAVRSARPTPVRVASVARVAVTQAPRWSLPARPQARMMAGLTETDVAARVVEVLKNMEKIDESVTVTADSHWLNDLGLDSLDAVEVVMAIEDEFSIEISDEEMEKMQTTADAIKLVLVS
jgi:NADH dehydrogenase (ubiquinone) 1 alpha/beta subcomplex 1, acyl-carrier protein